MTGHNRGSDILTKPAKYSLHVNEGFCCTEEMGTQILDDLHSQRSVIQRARERVRVTVLRFMYEASHVEFLAGRWIGHWWVSIGGQQ